MRTTMFNVGYTEAFSNSSYKCWAELGGFIVGENWETRQRHHMGPWLGFLAWQVLWISLLGSAISQPPKREAVDDSGKRNRPTQKHG